MKKTITACQAKLHRVKVTDAKLNYVGSITIDRDLLVASGIEPYQMVHINNCANGEHWETYVLAGEAGKKEICLNGPPAHKFKPGDIVIIVAYCEIDSNDLKNLKPIVVFVDDNNVITKVVKHDLVPLGPASETFGKK